MLHLQFIVKNTLLLDTLGITSFLDMIFSFGDQALIIFTLS